MASHQHTTGSITKALLTFVGPFLLSMVLQSLYGTVDLLLVGRFSTTADVAAVSTGSQLMFMVTRFIIGLTTGATVLVGNHFGARNERELRRTTGSSVWVFSAFGVVLTLVVLFACPALVTAMQVPPEAVAPTQAYLSWCAFGILFIMGFNIGSCIWLGVGDTRATCLCIAMACGINIALDFLLVGALGMGAQGAAIATVIAQAGSFLFTLALIRRKGLGFPVARRDLRMDKRRAWDITRTGIPLAVQNVLVSFSFLFITAAINSRGVVFSAASGVVQQVFSFLVMPASGMGAAVATVTAQNIGAGLLPRAERALRQGVLMALAPSVILYLICLLFGTQVAALFTRDPQVIAQAALYMRSNNFDCMSLSFIFCVNGYFNSMGYSWFTMFHSLLTTFAVRVPLTWLLSTLAGSNIFTIGLAPPLSSLVSLALCAVFYRRATRQGPMLPASPANPHPVERL